MSADNETDYPGDASGQINPLLQQVSNSVTDPTAQQWVSDGSNAIQNYLTHKAVVADNAQAADQMQTNMADTKDGLASFVRADASTPGIDLALGLASHYVNGVVSQHQHLDDDTRAGIAGPLIDHMQTEITHAGIQAIADRDKGEAYDAIDKYDQYLPAGHADALHTYADHQEMFRGQDIAAMGRQKVQDDALAGYQAATQHLASFTDPDTNSFKAQPGFIQDVMGDHTLAPATKLSLNAGYQALTRNGDVPQSNPHVAADLLSRIGSDNPPQQGEIISHVGSALTLNDASFFNSLIGPADPQRKADLRTLSDVVGQAHDQLATRANGAAGVSAFGRFTNWLTPALQRGANLTDLMADNRIQQFAPTPAEHVDSMQKPAMRPSLHSIFATAAGA
jgi:hypothetical protein